MLSTFRSRRRAVALGAAALLGLTACSGGASSDGTTEITWLVDNGAQITTAAQAMIDAFEDENPEISVKLDTRPGGTEGDNLVKTRLSTGEMADVFYYNSGSLLTALNPDSTLVDLSQEPWVDGLDENYKSVVSTETGLYGAPLGTAFGGGINYNKRVYEELGLTVPQSWAEFNNNNEVIKGAGLDPIIQTYGETSTSQLLVLSDFANVLSADPDWADEYTNNERTYADKPAISGFKHLEESGEAGYFNRDYASASFEDGLRMLVEGSGVHYPSLSLIIATIQQQYPDAVKDIGFFATPADDSKNTQATMWQPNSLYIPKSTEDAELAAAKKLLAFVNSEEGCDLQNEFLTPAGPYTTDVCTLLDSAPPLLADIQSYVDAGASGSALEFLSPIKGPNLENIAVEVGSGIRSAEDGAKLYDEDVKKQAQQLGLTGW